MARGFTLLEALVALVLMSTVGLALYQWINTDLIALDRARAVTQRERAVEAAFDYMRTINPMENPSGAAELGDRGIEWRSEPIEEPRQGVARTGKPSAFRVGLYRCRVVLTLASGETVEFTMRRVGYRRNRDPASLE